jgi:hypothetical protein
MANRRRALHNGLAEGLGPTRRKNKGVAFATPRVQIESKDPE